MVSYDALGPGGRVILHAETLSRAEQRQKASSQCRTAHDERRRSQFRKERLLDINPHTDSGVQRVPVRVKGKTFGLTIQKTHVWIIPANSDAAPRAAVAPVQQLRKLWRHRGQKRPKACGSSEKPATSQHPGRARDSWER